MPYAMRLPPFPVHECHTNSLELVADLLADVAGIGAEPMARVKRGRRPAHTDKPQPRKLRLERLRFGYDRVEVWTGVAW